MQGNTAVCDFSVRPSDFAIQVPVGTRIDRLAILTCRPVFRFPAEPPKSGDFGYEYV